MKQPWLLPVKWVRTPVLSATESRADHPLLSLEYCVGPVPPGTPTCGHTDKEQVLALFPDITKQLSHSKAFYMAVYAQHMHTAHIAIPSRNVIFYSSTANCKCRAHDTTCLLAPLLQDVKIK
jgi:hypothetical protein